MRDQMDGRLWDHHGEQFTADMGKLFAALRTTYCRIAAIRFTAPWRPRSSQSC